MDIVSMIKDSKPMDIVSMIKDSKRTWTISKRALTCMSKVADHACALMIIPANPCVGIKLESPRV